MWLKASSIIACVASVALGGNPCRVAVQKSVVADQVLVPATIGGHTNVLVAVPSTVAFSQIAVQVGVPVATYSPLAYQPAPRGAARTGALPCRAARARGAAPPAPAVRRSRQRACR